MHNGVVKEAEATESKSYTNSQKKYNGEDYKSTKDPNYRQNWYNTSTYSNGASIARDNEARRLEVMANTITINGSNEFNYANTWMCAETSLINIPVDAYDKSKTEIPENSDNTSTTNNSTKLAYDYTEKGETVLFGNMNFGLALRPNTNIVLEKHITALKITPSGTGVQPIVDASKNIEAYYDEDADNDSPKGMTQGLATVMSTRDNRGFWQVATDVEELMQGAELEVEYTYVIKNDSERDYLNSFVVEEYYNNIGKDVNNNGQDDYSEYLRGASGSVKTSKKGKTHEYGTYLGQYYYTGEIPLTNADVNLDGRINNQDSILLQQYINGYNIEIYGGDINNDGRINNQDYILLQQYINNVTIIEHESVGVVPSRVEIFEEAINNDLVFDNEAGTSFKITEQDVDRNVYGVDKNDGTKAVKINSVVRNSTVNEILLPGEKDANKIITLRTTLSTVAGGELGANIPSYIAELVQYSNAAGRRNMNATPRNLKYVHSDDTTMTMVTAPNEVDEFWGESIIITKPTGEDKITPIQIAIITISAVAVLGVGIVLIKKFVLKK